jgi:L-lactate dehydrogenase complex protein LldG
MVFKKQKMTARRNILESIAKDKPAPTAYSKNLLSPNKGRSALIDEFIYMVGVVGGSVIETDELELIKEDIRRSVRNCEYYVNTISALGPVSNDVNLSSDAPSLAPVYKAFIRSKLGVAENGSVWLSESDMVNRLLPFICQHLVIVLDVNSIVSTMHDAYKVIKVGEEGYGVFLSGPSKTADIEQALVIGAHGSRSLLVYLV